MYGLKEEALAKCYVRVLGLDPKKTEAGRRLVSWKQPTGRDNVSRPISSILCTSPGSRGLNELGLLLPASDWRFCEVCLPVPVRAALAGLTRRLSS